MNDELQKVVDAGKLTPESAEKLDALAPGTYCIHKSWGFGKVTEWNLLTNQILIDFSSRKGHPMQLEYAAESLDAIPPHYVRAQLADDCEATLQRAKDTPGAIATEVIGNLGGRATVEQIQAVFCPHAMDAAAFRKWWDAAKKQLKKDPHIHLPAKKSDPVEIHETPVDQGAKLIEGFHGARHPKAQVLALDSIVKSLDDLAKEVDEMDKLARQVEDAAKKGQRLHATQAVELLLARDEICGRHEALKPGPGAPVVADILRGEASRLPELFAAVPAAKHRKLLSHFKEAFGDRWQEKALHLARNGSSRLGQEIAKLFEEDDSLQAFAEILDKWIRERSMSCELLVWICKERGADFRHLFTVEIFSAVVAALEQDMLADITRGTKLHDLVMDDPDLMRDILAEATPEQVRDVVRKLKLTTVFDDLDKRSLLARIIKLHPEIQAMVTGERDEERDESLVVSWASLERRRKEYEDLINRQIPQNTRDISIARSYGDLRENFEFKSAKEQQRVLLRRKQEMEQDLSASRGTNFEDVDTSKVSIGSVVALADSVDGSIESYAILGAWDSLPDKGIVSYQAAIGQALLGRAPGEELELPTESGVRRVRIESIDAFKDLELLGSIEDTVES